MRPRILISALGLFLISGCGAPEGGFRFRGEYEAARSGFRVHIVSQGRIEPDLDLARTAVALVRICPEGAANGEPFTMTVTTTPEDGIRLETGELGSFAVEWTGKNSEISLRALLSTSGFRSLDREELLGTAKAIEHSLYGPKGKLSAEQAGPLRIVGSEFEEPYPAGEGGSPKEWIAPGDGPVCGR